MFGSVFILKIIAFRILPARRAIGGGALFYIFFIPNALLAQSYDTVWLSNTQNASRTGGDGCYMIFPRTIQHIVSDGEKRIDQKAKVKGVLGYDFYYRSQIDTPYLIQNFQQHNVYGDVEVGIKGGLSKRLRFSVRQHQFPLQLEDFNVGVSFDVQGYRRTYYQQVFGRQLWLIKDSILLGLQRKVDFYSEVSDRYEERYRIRNIAQEKVAFRELFLQHFPNRSISSIDSLYSFDFSKVLTQIEQSDWNLTADEASVIYTLGESCRQELLINAYKDSAQQCMRLYESLKKVDRTLDSVLKQSSVDVSQLEVLKQKLQNAIDSNNHLLTGINLLSADEGNPAKASSLNRVINGLRIVDFGRTVLMYSDFTAKQVPIMGMNLEYSQKLYCALAAGFVSFQFRDIRKKKQFLPNQFVVLGRLGWNLSESSRLIVSYYSGKKDRLFYALNAGAANKTEFVQGVSIAFDYALAKKHNFTIEMAKSSYPEGSAIAGNVVGFKTPYWFSFGRHRFSNAAVGVQYTGTPNSKTLISATIQKRGADFQSYSMSVSGVEQLSYSILFDKQFGRYLRSNIGVQKNEYSLYSLPNSNSNLLLTSMLHFVKPKFPSLSVGYHPVRSLVFIDSIPFESRFQTMTATAAYSFRINQFTGVSSISFVRNINQATDSSFYYFNATVLSINQQLMGSRWGIQTTYEYTIQRQMPISSIEIGGDCQLFSNFSLRGSAKRYYRYPDEGLWGYSFGGRYRIGSIGDISWGIETTYFPNSMKSLQMYKSGRFGFVHYLNY